MFMRGMLRRMLIRLLTEGTVQRVAVDGHDVEADDAVDRPQDYGFAGRPGAGSFAWVLEVDGYRIALRAEAAQGRPSLADWDVAMWHKEGHAIYLKKGRVIELDCDHLRVNATQSATFTTPQLTCTGPVKAPNIPA